MNLTLIILAAGIGRRYGGFKQMAPVGPSGEFIIDYSVFDAIRAGFDKVVFLISCEIEDDFRSTIGARVEKHIATDYVFQELSDLPSGHSAPQDRKKPWGTGHAVLACAHAVDGPFAVINADDFYGRESYELLSGFLRETADDQSQYCMVGFILRNTISDYGSVARGICYADAEGKLTHIVERTKVGKTDTGGRFNVGKDSWECLTGDELVSMNMWGFKPSLFPFLRDEFHRFLEKYMRNYEMEFYMPSVVDKMVVEKKVSVRVLKTPSTWVGVTYPQDTVGVVAKIADLIKSNEYPANLWE